MRKITTLYRVAGLKGALDAMRGIVRPRKMKEWGNGTAAEMVAAFDAAFTLAYTYDLTMKIDGAIMDWGTTVWNPTLPANKAITIRGTGHGKQGRIYSQKLNAPVIDIAVTSGGQYSSVDVQGISIHCSDTAETGGLAFTAAHCCFKISGPASSTPLGASNVIVAGNFFYEGYIGLLVDNVCNSKIYDNYCGAYLAGGIVSTRTDHNYDAGDNAIFLNFCQSISSGDARFIASSTTNGAGIITHAGSMDRIFCNKIWPYHLTKILVSRYNTVAGDGNGTSNVFIFNNQWDAGGANSVGVKIASGYDLGGTGNAIIGNKIAGVVINDNYPKNMHWVVDITAGNTALRHVSITDNHGSSGVYTFSTATAGCTDFYVGSHNLDDAQASQTKWGILTTGINVTDYTIEAPGRNPGALTNDLTVSDLPRYNTRTANTILAGPTSGGAALPAFRAITQADLGTGSGGAGTKVLYDDLTFKTPSAGSAFDPSATTEHIEDYTNNIAQSMVGVAAGSASSANYGATDGSKLVGHNGVQHASLGTNGAGSYTNYVYMREANGIYAIGDGALFYEVDLQLVVVPDGTNDYYVSFGFADTGGITEGLQNDHAIMTIDGTNANWKCKTKNAGTQTSTTSSSAPASATWYRLRISIPADRSNTVFAVNGTTIATNTTNIPRGAAAAIQYVPLLTVARNAGTTNRIVLVDYHWIKNTYTTAR